MDSFGNAPIIPAEFKWIRKLGKGGFGEVFEVEYKGNKYAAKKILKTKLNSERKKISFQRELCILKKMSNFGNSVKFFGHFQDNNFEIVILELCDGELKDIINNAKNGFNGLMIYRIMNGLNNAFKYMKENNIIHRDIKLENILIKYTDSSHTQFFPKINDYGLSREMNNGIASTYCGTPIYMAPEILLKKKYTDKADLWSIGVMIYYMHFKDYPFNINIYKDIENEYALKSLFARKKCASKEKDLDDLMNRLLIFDPNQRISWDEYFNHPFSQKTKVK